MEKLKIDNVKDYNFLSSLEFSPKGDKLCFIKKKADLDDNDYLSNLWIYNLEVEKIWKLTTGDKDSNFIWLDNENILFTSNRKDNDEESLKPSTEFYKINVNGGEAELFTEIPYTVQDFKYNSQSLLIKIFTDIEEKTEDELKEEKDYEVLDEIPFWQNGQGFTNKKRSHLLKLNLENKEYEKLIDDKMDILGFDLLEDKVVLNMRKFSDKMELESELYLYDLEKDYLEQLTEEKMEIGFVKFRDISTIYFTATDMKPIGINSNHDIYEFDLENKNLIELSNNLDKSIGTSVGNDSRMGGGKVLIFEDNDLYLITTEGYNSYLNKFKNGELEKIIDKDGTVDMFDINGQNIAYIGFRGNKLQELYLYQNGEEKQISEFNKKVLEDKIISTPEHFRVETSDGNELDAWIMKPVGYTKGKQYPTILEIHGGPKGAYGEIFFHEFQILANEGYAVVYSNPRGSSGRGNEFADIFGDYGQKDYKDLMKVMDTALEYYDFIDQDKLGVGGGSYGGFMTNWVIGQTDRFKAAVSQRSISNWISKFCTTDIGYFFVKDQFGGATPWSDFKKLWDGSPLKYADQVTTPTLFIHSEEDYRCWLPEGIQMFTALKYHDVDSRLCMFKEENHELSRGGKPEHRIRRLEEMVGWFNKYLKD
ncbi:MAG: S9 family peptidase [Candidatus Izemoplasmatales bacterium]